MDVRKNSIARAAALGLALTATLVVASAPAASSRSTARPLLASPAARTVPQRVFETAGGSSFTGARGGSRAVTASGGKLGITTTTNVRSSAVRIVIETDNPARARASVLAADGRIERSAANLIQALVAPGALSKLARKPGIDVLRAPYTPIPTAVGGEQVGAALAAAWHEKGFTGKGVKVGVIDLGFKGLAARQTSGDLPADVVTQDYCDGEFATEEDHGTAVAEIVHEMAPDAQLYLLCIDSEVGLAAAEAYAKSQGVTVINHSVGWEGPWRDDGSGPIGAIVADARENGILWVNSAGNEAQTHWSGTYAPSGNLHAWNPNGDIGNTFIWPNGSVICGFLKWDEWPAAVSDFDLGLFLSGANILLAASVEEQGSGQSPFEPLCVGQDSGADLTVFWAIQGYAVRSTPRLDLFSWSPPLEYSVAAGSIDSPASSPAVLAVGALCWQSRGLEPYSSQGPTVDGRTKPDIVGHDSVSGATYGGFSSCPSAFAGTSASSPEVAGAAALVKQAYPQFTPDQIKDYLMRAARDLGDPGLDSVYGAGELQLPKPPDVVAPTAEALPSSGRKGRVAKLLSRVSDDSGEVGVIEEIRVRGKVVARLKKAWFVSAARPKTVAVAWKVPTKAVGAYRHCVRAIDRAGNSTPPSCARIVFK